jgi:DNA-binding NtrC family response regulator
MRHFQGLLPDVPVTLDPGFVADPVAAGPGEVSLRPLPEQIAQLERRAIAAALEHTQGNKVATAKLLRISRASLYEKLALYGL